MWKKKSIYHGPFFSVYLISYVSKWFRHQCSALISDMDIYMGIKKTNRDYLVKDSSLRYVSICYLWSSFPSQAANTSWIYYQVRLMQLVGGIWIAIVAHLLMAKVLVWFCSNHLLIKKVCKIDIICYKKVYLYMYIMINISSLSQTIRNQAT